MIMIRIKAKYNLEKTKLHPTDIIYITNKGFYIEEKTAMNRLYDKDFEKPDNQFLETLPKNIKEHGTVIKIKEDLIKRSPENGDISTTGSLPEIVDLHKESIVQLLDKQITCPVVMKTLGYSVRAQARAWLEELTKAGVFYEYRGTWKLNPELRKQLKLAFSSQLARADQIKKETVRNELQEKTKPKGIKNAFSSRADILDAVSIALDD